MYINPHHLQQQVRQWLEEDVGPGDVTCDATVPAELQGKAILHSKAEGIFAGIPVLTAVFHEVDPTLKVNTFIQDGSRISKGTIIAEVFGNVHAILKAERVALNIVQRLSGIASKTNRLAEKAKSRNAHVRLVDTRKTTPGLRMLEKYAVRVGGGSNHRYGLFDAVLIKDNHIKAAGGLREAVRMARETAPHTMTIEVEVENLEQVSEALESKADIIMFDNMSIEMMKQAVVMIGSAAVTEASGGISIANIAEVAAIGVDVISMGSLTYSVEALDISLDLYAKKPVYS
ncbi:carboxylating nicotinate-nucleotide diphosphorylase [Paenibacillus alginolyticus]|uniref:nicotinate-nucleotide diphosphorylase (carboxylating) n=1 Tax=Paenibacillus alginolyticus TaxID=59839 RepID=A0ABT4GGY3_9BACL|nr:carboxylating nicotinate-nucleotide diphosphorylase [Paenibacillus alginolyticus]MCY9695459.1 carboxylating nicotinate-nucleotide diphosphorylase [Paenibacillus alginolyticus]MEC0146320.1 carboxylating nicotinate-nucleotide diphosphorylase [Paenibacillus alginolyticus]